MDEEYIPRKSALSAQNKSMNLAECRTRLERLPAADVVEVRHGRWHRFMKSSGQSGNTLICSDAFQCTVCKESFWNKSNYCPNCGAKMDGGQDE